MREVAWLHHCLDEETVITDQAEKEEGIETDPILATIKEALVVWVGDVPSRIPLALYGIKDGVAWMMTTRFLRDYRLHRVLLGAMRDVMSEYIRENGPIRGHVRTGSGAAKLLSMLGATFTLPIDVRTGVIRSRKFLLWRLTDNNKLRR